jgi:signal transduction histidine kinase
MSTQALHAFIQTVHTMRRQGTHLFHKLCINPRSRTEDDRRHEFILNIILSGSIAATAVLDIFLFISWRIHGSDYKGIPILLFTTIVLVFVSLLILSRKGYFKIASYILLALYFLSTTYGIYNWSFLLPATLLGYVITIIIASILISTRAGLIATGVVTVTILIITYLQIHHVLPVTLYWQSQELYLKDAMQPSILLLFIMIISWLSNREIEHSLIRARKSEKALLEERDSLEIKVEERTKQLKQMQAEKVAQLDRFAEFGRISSGLFHDLMNPLNAVIANVSQLQRSPGNLPAVQTYLAKAVSTSKRMGDLLSTIKKQFRTDSLEQNFSLNQEIEEAIDILQYKAREACVTFDVRMNHNIYTFGNPLKFHQIALNLIANAIDACEATNSTRSTIIISLEKHKETIAFSVSDEGPGIDEAIMEKLFDPFFTTKETGIGLGLSTIKDIIEKAFQGMISITTKKGVGTTFTVTFPLSRKS